MKRLYTLFPYTLYLIPDSSQHIPGIDIQVDAIVS